jgi:hemoglobin
MPTDQFKDNRSAYERIGGAATVAAATEALYERILDDERLASHFIGMDIERIKHHVRLVLTQMLGGPGIYDMTQLRAAHSRLCVSRADFAATNGHLLGALAEVGVPADIRALMRQVADSLEPVVVRSASGRVLA